MDNAERVESVREKCVENLTEITEKRKNKWDGKEKDREFCVGEEVLLRKPGMNFKLEESWEGPYVVFKRNSPLSYGVDTGERKIP